MLRLFSFPFGKVNPMLVFCNSELLTCHRFRNSRRDFELSDPVRGQTFDLYRGTEIRLQIKELVQLEGKEQMFFDINKIVE